MEIRKLDQKLGEQLPGLRPPQFRLRTLLAVMAVLAALLAAARWTGPVMWGVGLFAALSVLAHIAGNALGTQLRRRNGARFRGGEDAAPPRIADRPPPSLPSQLHQRQALGRLNLIATILGGIVAAAGGCWWIGSQYGAQAEAVVFLVAIAGFGGLGAFLTFLTVSFLQVVAQAVHHADTHGGGSSVRKRP